MMSDDAFYQSLINKTSTQQIASNAGRVLYSVKVTPQMANKHGVNFGRWPETKNFTLKRREDISGVRGDIGWVLIDKRMQMPRQNPIEPYRNAHGVELKPGNWFLGADQYGQKEGIIDRVVQRGGIADTNGGPSVVYKTAPGERAVQTILADNVFQTLGPMTIEGDGTVKQNPKERYPFTIHWGSSASLARMSSVGLTLAKSIHEAQALMREGARHVEVTEWHNGLGETIWKNGDFISPRKNPLTRVSKRINKSDTPPNCYFSHSDGQWRLIYQGTPLNADTPDLDRVRMVAQQFKVKPDSEFWDGDSGVWRPFPNPLTRVKRNSPSQRGDGGKPAKGSRLYNRRKTTEAAPPGFYANPTPRLERADQPSQREHFNAKTGKMTTRPTKRLKERRALTHYADTPGVWANPSTFLYAVFRMASDGTPAYFMRAYRTLKEAREYAQGLADKGGLSYGVIKKPL